MVGYGILAIDRGNDTFIYCKWGSGRTIELSIYIKTIEQVQSNAKKLYEQFETGDPGEYYADLEKLQEVSKEADYCLVIPKTKDRFLYLENFVKEDFKCPWPKEKEEIKSIKIVDIAV